MYLLFGVLKQKSTFSYQHPNRDTQIKLESLNLCLTYTYVYIAQWI